MIREPGYPLSCACFVASAGMLGHALQISNGFYHGRALVWLTLALATALAGTLALDQAWIRRAQGAEAWLRAGVAAVLLWQMLSLLDARPGMHLREDASVRWFNALMVAEASLIGVGVSGLKPLARAWFPLLLATHLAAGVWMLRASPNPAIDVVVVHREAFDALGHGRSPYRISFENIYGETSGFYAPAFIDGDRVLFGYPYPPLNLLVGAPAHALAGDYRYAGLFAWVGAAALTGFAAPTLFAKLAAAMLLTQPRGFFVLEQGWTEPIALLMLASTLFAMVRHPPAAAWAAGALLVTKQYLALAAPPLWRYAARRPGGVSRFASRALGLAALVTLPFVAWHPPSFVDSVLLLQTREPFRIDSLSYLSWAARQGWGSGSFVWALSAAALGLTIALQTTPPDSPLGFAASIALTTFALFAFGSKAFCNYYFFVAGALCCAAALSAPTARAPRARAERPPGTSAAG